MQNENAAQRPHRSSAFRRQQRKETVPAGSTFRHTHRTAVTSSNHCFCFTCAAPTNRRSRLHWVTCDGGPACATCRRPPPSLSLNRKTGAWKPTREDSNTSSTRWMQTGASMSSCCLPHMLSDTSSSPSIKRQSLDSDTSLNVVYTEKIKPHVLNVILPQTILPVSKRT